MSQVNGFPEVMNVLTSIYSMAKSAPVTSGVNGLGDIYNDDLHYTGETGDEYLTVQKYRNMATEFQVALNEADATYNALKNLFVGDFSAETYDALVVYTDDFESKLSWIKGASATLSAAGQAANAIGIRFPVVNTPSTLGAFPLGVMAGIAGALLVAAGVVTYLNAWRTDAIAAMKQLAMLETLPENERVKITQAAILAEQASSNSWSANMLTGIKIVSVAALAYFAFKLLSEKK